MPYRSAQEVRTTSRRAAHHAKSRRKVAYKKRQQNIVSMFLVVFAMFVIVGVIAVSAIGLQKKINTYDQKIEELRAEIAREEERAEKIEEFRKYTQTKGYVEEVAQDKLGLVYEGEIIFKQE